MAERKGNPTFLTPSRWLSLLPPDTLKVSQGIEWMWFMKEGLWEKSGRIWGKEVREGACDGQILVRRQQKLDSLTLIRKVQRQAEKYNPVIIPLAQTIAICRVFIRICLPHPPPPNNNSAKNQTQKNHFPFWGTSTCTNTQALLCFHPPPSWLWFKNPAGSNQGKQCLSPQSRKWQTSALVEVLKKHLLLWYHSHLGLNPDCATY